MLLGHVICREGQRPEQASVQPEHVRTHKQVNLPPVTFLYDVISFSCSRLQKDSQMLLMTGEVKDIMASFCLCDGDERYFH